MTRIIATRYARLMVHEWGCDTVFEDGTAAPSVPDWGGVHYAVISHRCGFGDDLMGYCVSHELMHLLVEDWMHDRPSQVLWGLAHGQMLSGKAAAYEELVAQAAQQWVWANVQPIVGGVDWQAFKSRALELWEA